jgi:TM2 domain-containing membrane protein YozV
VNEPAKDDRSLVIAYVLLIFLGPLGAHRFYLGQHGWGVVYALTGGGFCALYGLDFVLLPWHFKRRK